MTYDREKSDPAIVAVKPTNKAGQPAAESMEPRAGAEGNVSQQSTGRVRKQGDFPRKTGRRLSTNGQSLRGIRDLKQITERKQGDDSLETGGVRCSRSCPASDHLWIRPKVRRIDDGAGILGVPQS
jgi:hypothetical protein